MRRSWQRFGVMGWITLALGIGLATPALAESGFGSALVDQLGTIDDEQADALLVAPAAHTVHFAKVSLSAAIQISNATLANACRAGDPCIVRLRLNSSQIAAYLCDVETASRDQRLAVVMPCGDVTGDWTLLVWDRALDQQDMTCRELDFSNGAAIYGLGRSGEVAEARTLAEAGVNDPPVVADLTTAVTLKLGKLPRNLKDVLLGPDNPDPGPTCVSSVKGGDLVGEIQLDLSGGAALLEDAEDGRVVVEAGKITASRAFGIIVETE